MSSTESKFLMELENKEKYLGQWIAILDSKIIVAGVDLSAVYKEAMKEGKGRTPLFNYISKKQEVETLIL